MLRTRIAIVAVAIAAAAALNAASPPDPEAPEGMRHGRPEIMSMGAMTFEAGGILFIGDSEAASIHAVRFDEPTASGSAEPIDVEGIDARIAAALGTTPDELLIHDLAVHPKSRNVLMTVSRGRGNGSQPVLVRVQRNGDIEQVMLDDVEFATAAIPDAPVSNPSARRDPRTFTVTDLAFSGSDLFIAGLSNEEFSSAFRRMTFPFDGEVATTTLEIYHVSHGRNETNAPIMTFLPAEIDGATYILAAYTCTPLVTFPIGELEDGDHVVGRTVAELGAGNQPLDIVRYSYDGEDRILIANSRHPLMQVDPGEIADARALMHPSEEVGIPRTVMAETGIRQLDELNEDYIVVLRTNATGGLDLKSLPKSSL